MAKAGKEEAPRCSKSSIPRLVQGPTFAALASRGYAAATADQCPLSPRCASRMGKVTLPPYRIEPPDILQIDAVVLPYNEQQNGDQHRTTASDLAATDHRAIPRQT